MSGLLDSLVHRFRRHAFTGAPFAYVRTPLFPYEIATHVFTRDWKDRLLDLLVTNETFCIAVRIASPSLHRELAGWRETGKITDRAARRILAYALRASTRTTPFGVFAAISRVEIGERATLRIACDLRTQTRPDMGWLGTMIDAWRADPEFRRNLRVTVNDALIRCGDRYIVFHPALVHRAEREKSPLVYATVSFKATEAVKFLKEVLQAPVTLDRIARMLQERFGESREECRQLLDVLWDGGFFIDELVLDPGADPVRAVIAALDAQRDTLRSGVERLSGSLDALDALPMSRRTAACYRRVEELQTSLDPEGDPKLQTDAVREATGTLPARVWDDVATLVEIMLRWYPLELKRYRERFIRRYEGATREVPLLELVHPSLGLGVPDDLELAYTLPRHLIERRFALASKALLEGRHEIVLDAPSLDALLPSRADDRLAASFDLFFEILADSAADVDDGRYRLVGAPLAYAPMAGASLGRFAGALGETANADLRSLGTALEALHPDAVVAELVVPPAYARGLNVSIRPVHLSHQVRVGLMHDRNDRHVITADDLLVGLDDAGFYVRSLKLNKRVELAQTHMYDTTTLTPSLGRFLSLLTYDGVVFPHKFDWGPAENLTFLPRLRYERIIVAKARWRFEKSQLLKICSKDVDEQQQFVAEWRLPAYVQLVDGDNILPLDLRTGVGWELLCDHISPHTSDVVVLEELLPQPGNVWLEDERARTYRAEFVASFVRDAPRPRPVPNGGPVSRSQRLRAPGSDWSYVKLYIEDHDMDRFLARELEPLVSSLSAADSWFFVRYADPYAHIRLRLRCAPGGQSQDMRRVHERLARWIDGGVLSNVEICTYEREIERYGGVDGIEICESMFSVDSGYVLSNLLAGVPVEDRDRLVFASRTIAELANLCARLSERSALEFVRYAREGKLTADEREIVRRLTRELRERQHSEASVFRQPAAELIDLEKAGRLNRPVLGILDDVVHMHCNRCGLSPEAERRARLIARQALHGAQRVGSYA